MKRTILYLFLALIILLPLPQAAQEKGPAPGSESEAEAGGDPFSFDFQLMNHLPGGYFYPFVIENYAPDATFLTESSNGFALMDNPRVYFEGDSFVQFNWFYNGLNVNSALNAGAPGIMLPFSSVTRFRMQGENPLSVFSGMDMVSQLPRESYSRLMASTVYGDMGGYFMDFMIQPSHPTERADYLYNERRRISGNYFVDYQWARKLGQSHLAVGFNYLDLRREFNDFNAFDQVFEEKGQWLLGHFRLDRKQARGGYEVFGAFNYLDRSHQDAELAVYPQETIDKKRYSFLGGVTLDKKSWKLTLSLLHENESLTPNEMGVVKNLFDTDGDGIYAYEYSKLGDFSSTTLNLDFRMPFRVGNLVFSLYAGGRYSFLKGDETTRDSYALTAADDPYLVALWNNPQGGYSYTNSNADAEAGLQLLADISKDVTLLGRVWGKYNLLSFDHSDNNISFLSPGFDVGLLLFRTRKINLLFSYGRMPYDIRENANLFLETGRPSGALYHWDDGNGDLRFQAGEEGDVFGYTGGAYHFLDSSLSAPLKERLLLHFSMPLSRHFVFNAKALYKRILNNFRVGSQQEYGFYETAEGKELYFYDRPFGDYVLGNNYLEKDPFYAQFQFDIKGQKEGKWFFSFSFMAHMGMGDTRFGNGPGSNDIGLLSENQANPNSWLNGFGRVDGDRGFVAKCYGGFYLGRRLFVGLSLKYRDGDPFAFMGAVPRHEQWVLYYHTIKAEDEKGKKGGPREDYVADFSVRLNYRFKLLNGEAVLSLSFFNLLDFGAELSEYVFSGGTRDAVELQVPRSLRLTLNWMF